MVAKNGQKTYWQRSQPVVSAAQMQQIESWMFDQGMPVPALMEKAAIQIAQQLQQLYPLDQCPKAGILVGPGHNGGDALVVARELRLQGYQVKVLMPLLRLKSLTQSHANYAKAVGIPWAESAADFADCDFWVDGLFGIGLTRPLTAAIANYVDELNQLPLPAVSIDLPSGLHTDTGEVLGTAVQADHSVCLGLWKRAYFQDEALAYCGQANLLGIGIPDAALGAILGPAYPAQILTPTHAQRALPLMRPAVTHKYQQGHVLLVCGSQQYAGGAILTALGARASGVGMVTIAVPESIKPLIHAQCPEAIVMGCPETATGAIAALANPDLSPYTAIALGPGITLQSGLLVEAVIPAQCPLIIDADGLNQIAQRELLPRLAQRSAPTVLTPHLGEFKRLFPELDESDRLHAVQIAAQLSQAIVLLKGAKTAIATPEGQIWLIQDSTPALARGGSGDVLTGLMGGLLAPKSSQSWGERVAAAAWWHAQAALLAVGDRTVLGVDAYHLSQALIPALSHWSNPLDNSAQV
ncbi:MAG: NAD(P)H-hydrate dehydratase [Synechocystis sp.]|nr:NAD(P)H-hydrate dehydratase [Synechocystis sp.]